MKKQMIKTFITILLPFLFCTACEKKVLPIEDRSTAYLYLQAEPSSLDPRVGGEFEAQTVIRELFEGLTRIGKDGKYELALAKEYTISDDGLTYTFTLHPSLWSNGDPVTADDFVYAWKSTLCSDFITPYSYAFFAIKNAKKARMKEISIDEVGIKAIDPLTLQVTLEHQAPYFLEFTSNALFSPIHRKNSEKNQHWAAGTSQNSYISNGPFILKDRLLKSHISLQKNPYYWNKADQAKIENIQFSIIEDHQTAFNMYQSGHLDWIGDHCGKMSIEAVHDLKSKNLLKCLPKGGIYWLVVSTPQKHLSSPLIRRAIASAINREEITTHLLQGGETPAYSLLSPAMSMLDAPLFADNAPQKAKELFNKAIAELGMTKESYPPITISHRPEARERLIAEAIQQQLQKNLGIKIQLDSNDISTFAQKIRSGNGLQMGGFLWYSWFFDPTYNLNYIKYRNSGINGSQWENSDYMHCLDMANIENDVTRRNSYLKRAEEIAMSELPIIPIFNQTFKYATSKNFKGEVISRTGLMELKWVEKE